SQAGGRLPRHGPGEAGVSYFFFSLRPMSFMRRLTMSEAVRCISLPAELEAGWYVDQITWRDFASTRNIVPLPRPNAEFNAGLSSLFTVSVINVFFNSVSLSLSLAGWGSGAVFSEGARLSSCISKYSPMRSVK